MNAFGFLAIYERLTKGATPLQLIVFFLVPGRSGRLVL